MHVISVIMKDFLEYFSEYLGALSCCKTDPAGYLLCMEDKKCSPNKFV